MIRIGAIGCGPFMRRQHLQTITRSDGLVLEHLCDIDEQALQAAAEESKPSRMSTQWQDVVHDPEVQVLVVGVVPDLHPSIATEAIRAGKPVYVEKPIAPTLDEAVRIHSLAKQADLPVAVGFNRRFAPAADMLKTIFSTASRPLSLTYRISDDDRVRPPAQEWKKTDRLMTEVVHIFDLLSWLIGSEPTHVSAASGRHNDDLVTLGFSDGSCATIHSSSYGTLAQPKETLTALLDAAAVEMHDFVEVRTFGLQGYAEKTCFAGRVFDGCDNSHVRAFARDGLTAYIDLRRKYYSAMVKAGVLTNSGDPEAWMRFRRIIGEPPLPQINYCPDKGWGAALEGFCAAAIAGTEPRNANAAGACRANACAAAARKSIESGQTVALDPSLWQK